MRMSSWGVREVVFFSNPERRRSHCPELEHNGIQIHLHAQDSILVYNELEVNIVDSSQDPPHFASLVHEVGVHGVQLLSQS